MVNIIKKFGFRFICCTAFLLPFVLSSPAISQSIEWIRLLGTSSEEFGKSVAVDTSGNIYITGTTEGSLGGETNAGNEDIFLAKYDSSGTILWVKLLGTASDDLGYSVAVDTSGNIYVTGPTEGDLGGETNAGQNDIFLAKYDGSGTRLWVKLLGTVSGEYGRSLAVETSGNIYITGSSWEEDLWGEINAGVYDVLLAKYNQSGTMLWVKLLGTATSESGYGVSVDTSGNIYVTGYTYGDLGGESNAGNEDMFLAKYDESGTRQWVKLLGTAADDMGHSVTVDASGNIYVTGYTKGDLGGETNAGSNDIFLASYDGSGTIQWVTLLGTEFDDRGHGVTVDTSGNIYVTGGIEGGKMFLAKYNASGVMLGIEVLESDGHVGGDGLITNTSGDIYVTGGTYGSLGGETHTGECDIFLAKYKIESESFPWEIFYPAFIKKQ